MYDWDKVGIVQRTSIQPVGTTESNQFVQYETRNDGTALEQTVLTFDTDCQDSDWQSIVVDPSQTYQTIEGFGGAFTDAAVINMNSMASLSRDEILDAYFGTNGIGYSLGRVPMGSTDFSESSYSYVDANTKDFSLSAFSVSCDNDKIALIKSANKKRGSNLLLFSSVWTAPPWMKDNNNWVGGKLQSDAEYQKAWALYFSKFFEAYQQQGLDFWGCTVQNEPSAPIGFDPYGIETYWGAVTWESMEFTPKNKPILLARIWVRNWPKIIPISKSCATKTRNIRFPHNLRVI